MCPCHMDSRFGQPIQHRECGAHSAGMVKPRSAGFMFRERAVLDIAAPSSWRDPVPASYHRTSRRHEVTMSELSNFAITKKWPAQHPDRLQLYSLPTPNGVKVSIMLEEIGLPYEPHLVNFESNDQMTPEFRSLNPNNKIPAILDPNGPGGRPLPLFESGAILIYLAEKTGLLMPQDPAGRYQTIHWL